MSVDDEDGEEGEEACARRSPAGRPAWAACSLRARRAATATVTGKTALPWSAGRRERGDAEALLSTGAAVDAIGVQ